MLRNTGVLKSTWDLFQSSMVSWQICRHLLWKASLLLPVPKKRGRVTPRRAAWGNRSAFQEEKEQQGFWGKTRAMQGEQAKQAQGWRVWRISVGSELEVWSLIAQSLALGWLRAETILGWYVRESLVKEMAEGHGLWMCCSPSLGISQSEKGNLSPVSEDPKIPKASFHRENK